MQSMKTEQYKIKTLALQGSTHQWLVFALTSR